MQVVSFGSQRLHWAPQGSPAHGWYPPLPPLPLAPPTPALPPVPLEPALPLDPALPPLPPPDEPPLPLSPPSPSSPLPLPSEEFPPQAATIATTLPNARIEESFIGVSSVTAHSRLRAV